MPVICGVCKKPCKEDNSDSKCCAGCKQQFHTACANDDVEAKRLRSSKDWLCKQCRKPPSQVSESSSTSTSIALTKESLHNILDTFEKRMSAEIQNFRKEMCELKTSMEFLSSSLDTANNMKKDIKSELNSMRKECSDLRSENIILKTDVGELKERVRALEKYSRKNNIEISGIPTTAKEDVTAIVKDVGVALGLEVTEGEVAAAHRVPSFQRDRVPSLIVQFQSRSTRDTWIAKFKEKKTMTARDVNKVFPANRVFVNEHLSPDNKVFLATLKKKSKELGYEYTWRRDGKFFVRKASGERCIRVNTQEEIDKLK